MIEGLTTEAAARRLATDGPNALTTEPKASVWALVREQVSSPLIGLLAAACVASALLGEVVDAIAIGTIVVINGVIGVLQQYRAERALAALRSVTAPHARVRQTVERRPSPHSTSSSATSCCWRKATSSPPTPASSM